MNTTEPLLSNLVAVSCGIRHRSSSICCAEVSPPTACSFSAKYYLEHILPPWFHALTALTE